MQPQKPVHAANERPQHLTTTIQLPGMWLKLVPLLHKSNLKTAGTNGMVGLSHESSKVNPTLPSLALSQKSCSTRGQSTHVKIKTTKSVGRLNLSAIDGSDYRGKTYSSWTTLPSACGHIHLATSLPHHKSRNNYKNARLTLTTLCSTVVTTGACVHHIQIS